MIGGIGSFGKNSYIVGQPIVLKTPEQKYGEDLEKDANKAKQKSFDERSFGDHLTIGVNALNKFAKNPPAKY